VKVRGQWAYLDRAVDNHGSTIEFYLSPTRNTAAAKRFLGKASRGLKDWEKPSVINTDKAPTCAAALAGIKKEGRCPADTLHRLSSPATFAARPASSNALSASAHPPWPRQRSFSTSASNTK
jgi:transposase-like protein